MQRSEAQPHLSNKYVSAESFESAPDAEFCQASPGNRDERR